MVIQSGTVAAWINKEAAFIIQIHYDFKDEFLFILAAGCSWCQWPQQQGVWKSKYRSPWNQSHQKLLVFITRWGPISLDAFPYSTLQYRIKYFLKNMKTHAYRYAFSCQVREQLNRHLGRIYGAFSGPVLTIITYYTVWMLWGSF